MIVVIAVIDALAIRPRQSVPWSGFVWSVVCWVALAKPWFFTGPYLERINALNDVNQAITNIPKNSKISTTSYLVPHLSQRPQISFPRQEISSSDLIDLDVLLLNPNDPGWGSSALIQKKILLNAKNSGWICRSWPSGLELCGQSFDES